MYKQDKTREMKELEILEKVNVIWRTENTFSWTVSSAQLRTLPAHRACQDPMQK